MLRHSLDEQVSYLSANRCINEFHTTFEELWFQIRKINRSVEKILKISSHLPSLFLSNLPIYLLLSLPLLPTSITYKTIPFIRISTPPPNNNLHQFQTSRSTIDRCINPRKRKTKASFARTKIPSFPPSPPRRYRFLDHPSLRATKRSTLPSVCWSGSNRVGIDRRQTTPDWKCIPMLFRSRFITDMLPFAISSSTFPFLLPLWRRKRAKNAPKLSTLPFRRIVGAKMKRPPLL